MHANWRFKAPRRPELAQEELPTCCDPRPDFLCIGAQRAGTSWLYRQLAAHPDFWMPPVKELHYFDQFSRMQTARPRARDERDTSFLERLHSLAERMYIDLEEYGRLFEPKAALRSGDITPAYSTLNDEIIERIVSHFPETKVIFFARDPVERAWSSFSLAVRERMIPPFDPTDAGAVMRNLLHPGVLLRSYPSKIVARWKRHVRPELFRVFFFDDLEQNPAGLRRSVLQFLAADPEKPSGRLRPNHNLDSQREKLRLTDKVRAWLAQFFRDELKACARELGGPAKAWPTRYGFSLICFVVQLIDNLDLFFWCDWVV
jgi:hypothetical protein